ncbi:TorF family putative porin [Novosphingobium sp.]|uniref:TorF family putative porin n=1 Tax=Novosphingobium sp. TaxID=1874826 RepID=UPI0033415F3A
MRATFKTPLMLSALATATVAASPAAWADEAPAAATPPASEWTITGSAALSTQYRFRGIAQSDNRPVVQGAFTISHASGFYISTWGSSASAVDSPINIGGTEIDIFGGYTHAIGKTGLTIDGGIYTYIYPGATTGNVTEIYGSLAQAIGPATLKVGANFAPAQKVFNYNWVSTTRSNLYAYVELGASIPNTPITLHSHLAHTGGGFDYPKQYLDYTVGATYKWKSLSLDASLVGTNISRSDFANSGLANVIMTGGEGGPVSVLDPNKLEGFYRTGKPVAVITLTASF